MKIGSFGITLSCAFVFTCLSSISQSARGEVRVLTGDSANQVHNRDSFLYDVSGDGDYILFGSGPPSSGSTPGITTAGLYLRKISANTLTFVGDATVANGVTYASLSDNGRYIAWSSSKNQIYWRDTQTGTTRHITAGAGDNSVRPIISADGRYVAFASSDRTLVADASKLPAVNRAAVYIYDSQTNTTTVGSLGTGNAGLNTGVGTTSLATVFNEYDLSADGRYLVFSSDATNTGRPADFIAGFLCIYRRDLQTGELVILNRNSAGAVASGNFGTPRISGDGNRAIFSGGFVGILGPTRMTADAAASYGTDLFVKDVATGGVWWASRTIDNGAPSTGSAFGPDHAINGNGSVVSFGSSATNFVVEGTDTGGGHSGTMDLFRVDLASGGATTTTLITKSPTGTGNVDYRSGPFLPGTGNYVAFCTSQLGPMLGTGTGSAVFFQGIGVGTLPAVVGPPVLTFSQWAMALPAGQRGYGDMPQNDGVKNLAKYFLGMNPLAAGPAGLPQQSTAVGSALGLAGDSNRYLSLTFRVRREVPAGFTWRVQASADLMTLSSSPVTAVQVGAPVADGDFDVHTFRYPAPMPGRGFMRVEFTGP